MSSTVDDRQFPATAPGDRVHRLDATARWLDAELAGQDVPPLLAVIGLGDGELLTVLERRAPATKILAFEPDPAAAARLLQNPEAQRWRESGRLVYLVDPDYAGAEEAWRAFPPSPEAHKLIVRPDVVRETGAAAIRAARAFKQILFGVNANAEARRKFAPGYLAGTLHNLPEILAGQDVRALTDAYRGMPAIIAAAGPSLDTVLDDLAAVGDRGVLIAADTALRPLLTRGLSPQFVAAVDPQPVNARHFHALPPCPDTWLVSEASIDPSVIQPFGRRAFWFRVSNHEPWSWYSEIGIDAGRIDVWGSVVTAAFQIAVLAGCDPIVFVGADLSFTGNRPYCRGTTYEFDWGHGVAGGQSIDQVWRPFMKPDEQIRVPDLRGRETITSPAMQSFRDWLVARAKRSGRRVVNATGAGILSGDGIEQQTLRDVLTTARQVPSPGTLARVQATKTSRADVARHLWDVHRSVCRNAQSTPPLDRWRAFCGDGFSLDAVGAALERAARVFERPEAALDAPHAVIPWSAFQPGSAPRAVLTHLPEAMTRWRAALAGGTMTASTIEGDSASARLAGAFDLLQSICVTASTAPDLAAPLPAGCAGRAPLGALHTWPVELGRAVRLFEALLGDAWPSSGLPPVVESSFFSRHVARRSGPDVSSSDETPKSARPHLDLACTYLALEWWLAASFTHARSEAERLHIANRWRRLVTIVAESADARVLGDPLTLARDVSALDPIGLPLPAHDAALARVLTGAVRSIVTPAMTAEMPLVRRSIATPRVLTDEGVVRGVLPYSSGATARCTALRGAESFVVHEDGSTGPAFAWPRPTNGELPYGDSGAVAWSVGSSARWPDGGSGYVMYRATADAEPVIETLPFAPQTGVWWRGRIYWACFPFGVGSWAPGEGPAFALPDRTLFSVLADESGLLLGPRARARDGAAERRLITQGERWQPGQDPQPFSLGPLGVASSQTVAHGWSATAHPEADVVELRHKDGARISMTCYCPFGVAWAGRSLLVSTVDGELVFFERFTDVLDAWTEDRR